MRTAMFFFACVLLAIPCSARIITVDDDGPADFNTIQAGIDHCWDGDTVVVSPGTYTENIYFNRAPVTVTSTDPNDPDVVESTIITASSGYSVNFDFFEDDESVLMGFTVTNRGVYCKDSSPTITRNVIRECDTAGITGQNAASPTISYNTICDNSDHGISECYGLISHNRIERNTHYGRGAGLYRCGGTVRDNKISHNSVRGTNNPVYGGGLAHCNGTIVNNVISGNTAMATQSSETGGGLYHCNGFIVNNTIVGNTVGTGSGGGLFLCEGIIKNNIIGRNRGYGISSCSGHNYNDVWDNSPANYSDSPGPNDIPRNPLFAVDGYWDANGTPGDTTDDFWVDGDYHLLSEAGRWDANSQSWVLDNWTSYCIDGGDPCEAIGVEPNPNGGRINMGAYGGTSEASKSPSGVIEPVCTKYPTMDFNRDCKVDFKDFAPMAENWLECNLDPPEACWE